MLAEDGHKTTLGESSQHITTGNLQIVPGEKYNNLYLLIVINREGSINVAEMTTTTVWHGRLSHMSQSGLERLSTMSYIPTLLRALSIRETNSKSALGPLRDGTTTPGANPP